MRFLLLALVIFLSINSLGQDFTDEYQQKIVDEGKLLYKSEMTSWIGTDIFIERCQDKNIIGGYFSYLSGEKTKCIFFSKDESPDVIGTITLDSTFDITNAKVELNARSFTKYEEELYYIRKLTIVEIFSDTLYKHYKNMSFNIIPLIDSNSKRVYILTGPQESGVIIFGNDYLLTFDNDNNLIDTKKIHQNIIPVYYEDNFPEDSKPITTVHNHSQETGELITATDICTLMLYEKFTNWASHSVISDNYMSIWSCKTDQLMVLPMEALQKIYNEE